MAQGFSVSLLQSLKGYYISLFIKKPCHRLLYVCTHELLFVITVTVLYRCACFSLLYSVSFPHLVQAHTHTQTHTRLCQFIFTIWTSYKFSFLYPSARVKMFFGHNYWGLHFIVLVHYVPTFSHWKSSSPCRSLTVAMCAVLAGARSTAVRTHGSGVSVHVSRWGCHYSSVSGQERNKGESLGFQNKPAWNVLFWSVWS